MLRKLLKYELKATARIFLPLYAVLLIFAFINRLILNPGEFNTPQIISTSIYFIIMVGMFVMTYVVMIQRFYRNLLSDEGYLMFTLPTTTWRHITSKLLISMMWMIASGIAACASILIIASGFYMGFWRAMMDAFATFFRFFDVSVALFIVEIILFGIVGLASTVLIIYASIAVGHLFNQHRVLASLGAFLAFSTVSQILFAIVRPIWATIFMPQPYSTIHDFYAIEPLVHLAIWSGIAFLGVLSAGYFFISSYILSKRLNLE